MTTPTPTPTQLPAAVPEALLIRQQLADRFSFLEGVVNECNYLRIIDTAFAIYGEGAAAAALSAAAPAPPTTGQVSLIVDAVITKSTRMEVPGGGFSISYDPATMAEAIGNALRVAGELRATLPDGWSDGEHDGGKPRDRSDLERVLREWNDTTGALPARGSWLLEVLGMMQDAYDLGAHQGRYAVPQVEQPGAAVPGGWSFGQPITEEMHVAACKVLTRANGLDGTPQRMLDAMLAAAPAAPMSAHPSDPDDSVLLCISDLEHSAIYDNHREMQACMRAVSKRLKALGAAPGPAPTTEQAGARPGIPGAFITHRTAWRRAVSIADQRELAAFDRAFDRLWVVMGAAPGGEAPAPDARPILWGLQYPSDREAGRICIPCIFDQEAEAKDWAERTPDSGATIVPLYGVLAAQSKKGGA